MIAATLTRFSRRAGWALGVAAMIALLLVAGRLVPQQPAQAALLAIAVLAIGLTLFEPMLIPLLAMPTLFVIVRVSGGGADLSFSDLALFIAFLPALFLGVRPFSRPMRSLLWLSAVYQFATLFAVIANPYRANAIEWFHAWLLISGALVVGWAIGRRGYARTGLSLILLAASAIAVLTIVEGLRQARTGNLGPVYLQWPYGMHKNFIGTTLGFAAVVAYSRPSWLGWSRRWALSAFWVCAAGILLSQSRQALIGLSVALLVLVLRKDPHIKRSKVIVLAIVPILAMVGTLVQDQAQSGNKFNSVFQRLTWFNDSITVFLTDPWFGVGLRWWYSDRFPVRFQPPNAEIEVLTSAGVVGLLAFGAMMIGGLVVLWRMDPVFGSLAFTVVLSRLVQSQFDLFWVAAQVSIPFVIAGICLGAESLATENRRSRETNPLRTKLVAHS